MPANLPRGGPKPAGDAGRVPRRRAGQARVLGLAALGVVVAVFLSLAIGAGIGANRVGPGEALAVLAGGGDDWAQTVVRDLRLPRTVAGLIVGLALGIAGVVLQSAVRNPLAEPGLLGISAGAAFAVVLAIHFGASTLTLGVWVAVVGALAGCGIALLVARVQGDGEDPLRLILAGAALSGMLGATTSLLLLGNQRTADELRFWTIGALAGRSMGETVAVLPAIALGLVLVGSVARPLAALALGERVATGLGHRPRLVRVVAMTGVAFLVGGATAAAGPIAFVGLVAPFAARALVGPDPRRALVVSALLGPVLVLTADVLARLLVRPSELPLGVVTAFVGAPVLVAVVRARRVPTL